MKRLSIVMAALFAFSLNFTAIAQATNTSAVTVKVLTFEGAPVSGARISIAGLPLEPQLTSEAGATQWSIASGTTYSFNVQYKPSESPLVRTNSFDVQLFASGQTSVNILKLPKLVTVRIPLEDSANYGSNVLAIQWKLTYPPSLEVNGTLQPRTYGIRLPNILQISDGPNGRFATLQYFEPNKMPYAGSADIDNDQIPDHTFSLVSPLGSTTYVIPSGQAESNPPALSLSQSHWVKATSDNEGVALALMLGDREVTNDFPSGVFFADKAGPDVGSTGPGFHMGFTINGSRATFRTGGLLSDVVFGFASNQIAFATSSLMSLKVKSAICFDTSKGFIRQFQTLGACPKGWIFTASVRKLSEKKYASCAALNKVLVGGVGKPTASNRGKRAFKGWLPHAAGYLKNKHLDKDKDGIACER